MCAHPRLAAIYDSKTLRYKENNPTQFLQKLATQFNFNSYKHFLSALEHAKLGREKLTTNSSNDDVNMKSSKNRILSRFYHKYLSYTLLLKPTYNNDNQQHARFVSFMHLQAQLG